jgi:hypothetical protein
VKKQWMRRALAVAALALAPAAGVCARTVELPVGTPLSVRLTTRVSSSRSHSGDPVDAVLIAPVELDGRTVLPAGWTLQGTVREAARSGGRASLRLDFSTLVDEDYLESPIATRVVGVDNSRESVADDGRIVGFRPKRRLPSRLAALLMLVAYEHPIALAAFETGRLVLRAAQRSAIDYRPGVELSLALTAPLTVLADAAPTPAPAADASLSAFARAVPFRTQAPQRHRDADVTNLLLVGSKAELEDAFLEAGWTRAQPMGLRARLHGLLALVLKHGYGQAAVSHLDLAGRPPDLVFEKQNNTLAKRHHVRIWQQQQQAAGETLWVGAASHDVGIVFNRRRHAFTHRIDPRIDAEREKIVNDLQLTGEVSAATLLDRPNPPQLGGDPAGDPIETDGRMAVVVLRPAHAVTRLQ